MRKIQKLLLGVFAFGVLLTGIGTGVALVEFSSLNYGGHKVIGEENLVTKTLEFEVPEEYQEIILGRSYSYKADMVTEVTEDSEMPERKIQYEVTFNEERIRPFLLHDRIEDGVDTENEVVRLYLGLGYLGDGFGEFMENKDMILSELKQKTISSYDTNYVTKVVIKANPETMDLIQADIY